MSITDCNLVANDKSVTRGHRILFLKEFKTFDIEPVGDTFELSASRQCIEDVCHFLLHDREDIEVNQDRLCEMYLFAHRYHSDYVKAQVQKALFKTFNAVNFTMDKKVYETLLETKTGYERAALVYMESKDGDIPPEDYKEFWTAVQKIDPKNYPMRIVIDLVISQVNVSDDYIRRVVACFHARRDAASFPFKDFPVGSGESSSMARLLIAIATEFATV